MIIQFNILQALAVFILIGCGSVLGQAQAKQQIDPAVAELGNF